MNIKTTDIKMRVNEKQSKQVQEICFELGVDWNFTYRTSLPTQKNLQYLYISEGDLDWGLYEDFFESQPNKEVSAEDFIRTKGFTISEEEQLKTKALNNFNDYGFEADFEGEILKELVDHKGKKYFIGYSIDVRKDITYPYPKTWTEEGECIDDNDINMKNFNLNPLKKLLKQVLLIKEDDKYELEYKVKCFGHEGDVIKNKIKEGWTYANLDEVLKLVKPEESIKEDTKGSNNE